MTDPQRYVSFFDIHAGYEKRRVGRDYKTFPTHNKYAIAAAMAFVKDFQPDTLILGGDQLTFAPVSHWNKDHLWANEGLRLYKEYDILKDEVLEPIAEVKSITEWIWFDGNHEQWIYDFIQKNPAVEGVLEPFNYLSGFLQKYKIVEMGGVYKLGKLNFIHGNSIGKTSKPAMAAASRYCNNIRFGHYHTYDAHTSYNPLDSKDIRTSVAVPALASIQQAYANGAPSKCLNGFNFGYVFPSGNFTDYTVVMADNKFMSPQGKYYDGNKLVKR